MQGGSWRQLFKQEHDRELVHWGKPKQQKGIAKSNTIRRLTAVALNPGSARRYLQRINDFKLGSRDQVRLPPDARLFPRCGVAVPKSDVEPRTSDLRDQKGQISQPQEG